MFCVAVGDFGGHGNSFHGEGGRGNRMAQLRYVLRLILNMCTSSNDIIRQDFTDQGAISLFIGIYISLINVRIYDCGIEVQGLANTVDIILTGLLTSQLSEDVDDAILIEMKTDSVIILSSLCEQDLHRKVYRLIHLPPMRVFHT